MFHSLDVFINIIKKPQKNMWHSSVNVGLDYLRGLEITELKKKISLSFRL